MGEAKLAFLKVKIFRGRAGIFACHHAWYHGRLTRPQFGVVPRVVTRQNLRHLWLGNHTNFGVGTAPDWA